VNYEDIYNQAIEAIDTDAIRAQAKRLLDLGLKFVVIPPTIEEGFGEDGAPLTYKSVGKKPKYSGWPDAAFTSS